MHVWVVIAFVNEWGKFVLSKLIKFATCGLSSTGISGLGGGLIMPGIQKFKQKLTAKIAMNQVEYIRDGNHSFEKVVDHDDGLFLTSVNDGHSSVSTNAASLLANAMFELNQVNVNTNESITSLNHILELAINEGDSSLVALTYHHLGNLAKKQGHIQQSQKLQESCIQYAKQCSDKKLEARGYKGLGLTYLATNNHILAKKYTLMALHMAESIEEFDLTARCHANLGNLYGIQGNHAEAIQCHLKDLKISQEMDSWVGQDRAHRNLSIGYEHVNDNVLASAHRQKASIHGTTSAKRDMKVHASNSIGNIYMQMENPNRAVIREMSGILLQN